MDIQKAIQKEHSRQNTENIAAYIAGDKKKFSGFMLLFFNGTYRETQRAAWILSLCAEKQPALIRPYLKKMLQKTLEPGIPVAVKRNVIRLLQHIPLPRDLQGLAITICFSMLADRKETIAVKVFSMSVLSKLAVIEPDIRNELVLLIREQLPFASAGFRSRALKILKDLEPGTKSLKT